PGGPWHRLLRARAGSRASGHEARGPPVRRPPAWLRWSRGLAAGRVPARPQYKVARGERRPSVRHEHYHRLLLTSAQAAVPAGAWWRFFVGRDAANGIGDSRLGIGRAVPLDPIPHSNPESPVPNPGPKMITITLPDG